MDNEAKEKASKVFNTIWDITKRYCFIPLDDFLWERMIEELEEKRMEFVNTDEDTQYLYRRLADAITNYKQRKDA